MYGQCEWEVIETRDVTTRRLAMEYVNAQIEALKEEQRQLEREMFTVQKRYHVFHGMAAELWRESEECRNNVLRHFAEMAGDTTWDSVMKVLNEGVDEHTYNRCKTVIGTDPKLLLAFVRACPHVMAHKLQEDLSLKSRACLVVNRRLNYLYMQATRAVESYTASCSSSDDSCCSAHA